MRTEIVISRVLNPKTSNMEAEGSPSTSNTGYTAADMAMACYKCNDIGFLALKRRNGYDKVACSGYYELFGKVINLAIKDKWEVRPKSQRIPKFRALLDICLTDYFEISRCRPCKGSGKKATDKAGIMFRTCQACDGTGNKPKNDSTRAQALGVSRSTYSRAWSKRYSQVMTMFDRLIPDAEYRAIRTVNGLLRDE